MLQLVMGIFHPVSKSVTDTNNPSATQPVNSCQVWVVGELEAAVSSRLSPDQQEFPQMWKLDVKIVTSRIFRVTSLCQIQFNLYLRAPGGLKLEIEHFYVSTRWLGCLAGSICSVSWARNCPIVTHNVRTIFCRVHQHLTAITGWPFKHQTRE